MSAYVRPAAQPGLASPGARPAPDSPTTTCNPNAPRALFGMMDVPERYFEDWKVGERFESGSLTLSEEQLVEFARAYDPQSFHIDAEAARATPFGGLIASGWQTAALSMRLLIESGAFGPKGGIGLGVDELRWPKPVFPGDTLHVLVEVASTRASRAKRSGVVHFKLVTRNQRGEDVMTQTAIVLVQSRPEPAA